MIKAPECRYRIPCVLLIWFMSLCSCVGVHRGKADRPGVVGANEFAVFEEALWPYVRKAQASLPRIKQGYQRGLAEGETLYVVVRLPEPGGFEQAYVEVQDWQGAELLGVIASRLRPGSPYRIGDLISFKESAVLDWVITKPDGYEEGNFVGRFLEKYRP